MMEGMRKRFYSREPMILGPLWQNGDKICEGDSNVALTNVKDKIHIDAFNIGQGGDVPSGCIKQLPEVYARHRIKPINYAYIQIGGNVWIWQVLNIGDLSIGIYKQEMRELIQGYKKIVKPGNIVIASLPFVNPHLTLADRMDMKRLAPKKVIRWLKRIKANNIFYLANVHLLEICRNEGVKYLDIFTKLKNIWDIYGSRAWWDDVHYAWYAQKEIGKMICEAWKVEHKTIYDPWPNLK